MVETTRKRKSSQKAEQRRAEIIDAARRAFAEHGLHGARISHIRDLVGISNGNLFYYFKTKEEILEAMVESNVDCAIRDIDAFLASHHHPLRALTKVSAVWRVLNDVGWNMPWGLRLEILAEAERNVTLRQTLQRQSSTLLALIERTLGDAVVRGHLSPDVNRSELARTIHLIWSGISMSRGLLPDFDVATFERPLVTLMSALTGSVEFTTVAVAPKRTRSRARA